MLATPFWEKHFCRFWELVVSVLLVSWWSVNCVSVVVGIWWCACSVLTVSGDVLGALFMFFFGVSAVLRSCLGGIEGMVFS
jgi:hypothetical protein